MENLMMMYKGFSDSPKGQWAIDTQEALKEGGFSVLKRSKGSDAEFLQTRDGIYESMDTPEIKKWLLEEASLDLNPQQLLDLKRTMISKTLDSLKTVALTLDTFNPLKQPLPLLTDTEDEIFIPFQNGVVVITADEISLKEYSEVFYEGTGVWSDTIKPHNIDLDGLPAIEHGFTYPICLQMEGDFPFFLRHCMIRDNDSKSVDYSRSLRSMESVLGYLIHQYNDPANSKFIYLTDASVENGNNPQGGNGKSKMIEAIKYIRNYVELNGKGWQKNTSESSRFNLPTSLINEKTDVVALDDAREGWDAEDIFSHVTGDFETEDKMKSKVIIPEMVKPKIVVSSNHFPYGAGHSYDRRRHIVHVGNYWRNLAVEKSLEPPDVLGRRLYSKDWDSNDWNQFYHYFFLCGQRYLRHGLIPQPLDRLNTEMNHKSVSIEVGTNVAQWLSNHLKTQKSRFEEVPGYSQDDLYNDYKKDFPNDSQMTPTTLHKHLRSLVRPFMKESDYEYNPHKAHKGDTYENRRYYKGGIPHIMIGY